MKRPIQVFSYQIQNRADDEVDIHIDGDIVDASTQTIIENWFGDTTSTSYKSFRNELNKHQVSTYNVYINSPGGHVGDAMAIHDLLTELQDKQGKTVNTIGRGIVASSGTLILLAGKNPEMSQNSWFMMHTVSGGAYGTVDQVENYAKTMRKFNDSIRNLYASKSKMRAEDVTKLMNAETWLSAEEAKEKGFIATISGNAEFTNYLDKEKWDFARTDILNSYNNSVKKPSQIEDMKQWFANFKKEVLNAIKGIQITDKTTNQDLVNSIAEAIGNTFETQGESMETAVQDVVKNYLNDKKQGVAAMLTNALNNDKTGLTAQVNAILTDKDNGYVSNKVFNEKVEELENDIANKVGNKSESKDTKNKVEVIGSFD